MGRKRLEASKTEILSRALHLRMQTRQTWTSIASIIGVSQATLRRLRADWRHRATVPEQMELPLECGIDRTPDVA